MMNNSFYNLTSGYFAIKFKYHMVTEITLAMCLPDFLKLKNISFLAETEEMAGKNRMDSNLMRKTFPIEVAVAEQNGLNLKDYVLIKTK